MAREISSERLAKYFSITKEALDKAKSAKHGKMLSNKEASAEIFDMVSRYLEDAKYFEKKGDIVSAFAALNYAHGWLDAGARLGIFVVKDSRLFVVDDE